MPPRHRRLTSRSAVRKTTTYLADGKPEKIASAFAGVEKAFAVQAGRNYESSFIGASDDEATYARRGVPPKVENELQYPGRFASR